MSSFLNTAKEIRYWIILVFILGLISLGIYFSVKTIIDKKNQDIEGLQLALEKKPKVEIKYEKKIEYQDKIIYKDKWKVKKEVEYVEVPEKVKNLFNAYCEECDKEKVNPVISIDALRFKCTANICNQEESSCSVTDGFTITEEKKVKKGIAKVSVIGGYDFVDKGLVIGTSLLNYKGIVIGTDLVSDFQTAEHSGVGGFIGYRPEISKWQLNMIVGVGATSHFDDLQRIGMQGFVGVNILDRN